MKNYMIQFIIMAIVGILFNPMNMLAYRFNDLYLSLTLFYGGLLMASNMIWSHELVHYFSMGHFNSKMFIIGIILSGISVLLLRSQLLVNDKEWLKRMISHHSTALMTTHKINKNTKNEKIKKLSNDIIKTQEEEITQMKSLL
tara:strand:- start:74 stop:502 length:429 start_codon:yes stop_codon:yes gene_type:complete